MTDRDDNYGSPGANHRRIARLWEGYLDLEQGTIEAHAAAVMLGLLKDARIRENPDHRDNWVDKAGYAQCGVECVNDE